MINYYVFNEFNFKKTKRNIICSKLVDISLLQLACFHLFFSASRNQVESSTSFRRMSVNDIRKKVTKDIFTISPGSSEYSATFIFGNEDHTFGNQLRHIITQQIETDFCGYSVPHPYEPSVNIRIQSHDISAIEVLKKSLVCVEKMCNMIDNEFDNALLRYNNP